MPRVGIDKFSDNIAKRNKKRVDELTEDIILKYGVLLNNKQLEEMLHCARTARRRWVVDHGITEISGRLYAARDIAQAIID